MSRFKWDGREFEIVERPLFGEIEWLEKQSGRDFDDFTGTAKTRAVLLLSVRRGGVMLTWKDTESWSPVDFEDVEDEAVPTPPGAEAGPSRNSATSGGSTSRKSSASRRTTSTA